MTSPTQMADGSTAMDHRLGRLPEPDARNKKFPIRTLLRKTLRPEQLSTPRSYTWGCTLRLDQGIQPPGSPEKDTSSCTGNAVTLEAAARPKIVPGLSEIDAISIYHRAQQLDPWPGEDYAGSSVLAAMKAGKERGWYLEYRWATNLNDLILTVGYHGPVVLGIDWYSGMFDVDEGGYVRPSGGIAGGHAIMLNGVNLPYKRFRLTNSWGAGWGWDGQAWLDFADADKLIFKTGGEAAVPVRRAIAA